MNLKVKKAAMHSQLSIQYRLSVISVDNRYGTYILCF